MAAEATNTTSRSITFEGGHTPGYPHPSSVFPQLSSAFAQDSRASSPPSTPSPAPKPTNRPPKPAPAPPPRWTVEKVRELGQEVFGQRPCLSQIHPALALLAGKDVVNVAATGVGKTNAFLLRLLMARKDGEDKMIFGVTPLVMIGEQMKEKLGKAILRGEYQVVTVSPEIMDSQPFQALFKNVKIKERLLYVVFDKAHCISAWGKTFRPHYLRVGNLRHLLPPQVLFFITSAALPRHILDDIKQILRLQTGDGTKYFIHSNDRPNIHLVVRPMRYAVASYKDLAFLIPPNTTSTSPPPKFLVFMDNIAACEEAVEVCYFHSTMTTQYRSNTFDDFKAGDIWGMVVTDAFGMGLDIPDIKLVVQYRLPRGGDVSALWQRFGRAARDRNVTATAVLLVNSGTLDLERLAAIERSRKKRKAPASETISAAPIKRRKRTDGLPVIHWSLIYTHDPPIEFATTTGLLLGVNPLPVVRSSIYSQPPLTETQSKSKAKKAEFAIRLGSAIDDFINAGTRGLGCRREPVLLYFQHPHMQPPLHLQCNPSSPTGCLRCAPQPSLLCCDVCLPEGFGNLAPIDMPRIVKMAKTTVKKTYMPSAIGKSLTEALTDWRERTALQAFDPCILDEYGVSILMSDEVLTRLATCADLGKITDLASIRRETLWRTDLVDAHGDALLRIITEFQPRLPLAPIAPPQTPQTRTSSTSQSAPSTKRVMHCSICKQPGHNSMLL
ncbi:ATP-dependent DNA helicase RecQ [Mycena indigotica]|uniref:DNA 3'-5' helicase n=1 Tax=Mycena indigotica TaxID=2126181 RepID=A0A8H6SD79_9AGAR|nr:ATP-dependent DNA helicase RecQ [Mycena indigotica]KAF7296797.1 ATP-dependent DNA helicase RecQ [Mycena indigotica]